MRLHSLAIILAAVVATRALADNPQTLRGQTEPAARVEVPSAIRGIIAELPVKEGQAVTKDQTLARLDDALQKTKVEFERVSAEGTAEIRYAQNQLDFANHELEQFNRMSNPPILELQQKQLAVKQAELQLEAAKEKKLQAAARLKEEQLTLDRMTLRSPIDGSILSIKKQVGEQTDEGPVLVIVQTTKLHAVFYPGKDLFGKIAAGDSVTLTLDNQTRKATVITVDPIIDPASQIFRVKLEIENADNKIPAGTTATWTLTPSNVANANP